MKFDVIIGNPPYQLKDGEGGKGSSASPLYHLFVENAKQLNPKYISMIIPSRWFAGGKGLDEFRKSMLNDKRLSHLIDYPNASECFPDVEIAGGVCYFLWNSKYNGQCSITTHLGKESDTVTRALNTYDTFIRFNKAISIVQKVIIKKLPNFSNQVMSGNPFGLCTYIKPDKTGDITLYARKSVGKYTKAQISKNERLIPLWKVIMTKAYGGGSAVPNKIIGAPIVAGPNSACTETYLVVGAYINDYEAKNLKAYIETKFFRFMLSLKKNTQDVNQGKFQFVPQMDMTQLWDDEKLYAYFDITPEEREFIESMIKEMK
jgi:site-specific DNA-methyltransferase (adenine-specific)